MKLSILICTVPERKGLFDKLFSEMDKQIKESHESVQLIYDERRRQDVSVGQKRQDLLLKAKGDYIVYFDDDDMPRYNYISEIIKAINTSPDCIGFKIAMTTNGINPQTCIHSLSNDKWYSKGDTHYRNVTHFNPVKRDLALKVGFKDIRFGEDKDYADRVSLLCRTEFYIDKFLFDYRYTNHEKHNIKYGIK